MSIFWLLFWSEVVAFDQTAESWCAMIRQYNNVLQYKALDISIYNPRPGVSQLSHCWDARKFHTLTLTYDYLSAKRALKIKARYCITYNSLQVMLIITNCPITSLCRFSSVSWLAIQSSQCPSFNVFPLHYPLFDVWIWNGSTLSGYHHHPYPHVIHVVHRC